jgi:mRNA-degrading endonuclease toxin of MazEF toxin-antitoxin module
MKPGDICLGLFPLAGAGGRKMRPVLVLSHSIGDVPEYIVAYITSSAPPRLLASDLWLDPADPNDGATGLSIKSLVRLHKLATVHQRDLIRSMGTVSTLIMSGVSAKLRSIFQL